MKCDHCHNKATVFLTQIVNGQMKKSQLCEECANQKGVTDPSGFSLTDFINSPPFGGFKSPSELAKDAATKVMNPTTTSKCPQCGFALEDLQKIGRVGCSTCYQAFKQEISPALRSMHGAIQHKGKIPKHQTQATSGQNATTSLKEQLKNAIAEEDFERAAELRDEILKLEGDQSSSSN